MDINSLVNRFYVSYYSDYKPRTDHIDSYRIQDSDLTIEHHDDRGKRFTSVFSIWEVLAEVTKDK